MEEYEPARNIPSPISISLVSQMQQVWGSWYRWVIYISSDGDFNDIDDVGVFQGTEKGDFSDCGDGRSVTSFRGIDPYRLECNNLTRPAVSCTTGRYVSTLDREDGNTRLLRMLTRQLL